MPKYKSLEEIYAAIPKLNCKKKCAGSCGPVPVHKSELVQLRAAGASPATAPFLDTDNVFMLKTENDHCALLRFNECSVYSVRPLICRLYGVAEEMKCERGCTPTRYLTKAEVADMIESLHYLDRICA